MAGKLKLDTAFVKSALLIANLVRLTQHMCGDMHALVHVEFWPQHQPVVATHFMISYPGLF